MSRTYLLLGSPWHKPSPPRPSPEMFLCVSPPLCFFRSTQHAHTPAPVFCLSFALPSALLLSFSGLSRTVKIWRPTNETAVGKLVGKGGKSAAEIAADNAEMAQNERDGGRAAARVCTLGSSCFFYGDTVDGGAAGGRSYCCCSCSLHCLIYVSLWTGDGSAVFRCALLVRVFLPGSRQPAERFVCFVCLVLMASINKLHPIVSQAGEITRALCHRSKLWDSC